MTESKKQVPAARRPRRMAREPERAVPDTTLEPKTRQVTKSDILVDLLVRDQGATLDHLMEATGWLPHTTRAALTGLRRKGHVLLSQKDDGVRTYRIKQTGSAA